MTGIYDDKTEAWATRQPVDVLAAWIGDLLDEINGGHVRRLAELRARLQSDAFAWDAPELAQKVCSLHSAGREMHFDNLQPGWLARVTGRCRSARDHFLAARERILSCVQPLRKEAGDRAQAMRAHTGGARRMLVEVEIEANALQGALEKGVDWLQQMCAQLSDLGDESQRASRGPRLERYAEYAHAFTREFKRLQSAASTSRAVGAHAQRIVDRRSALLGLVHGDIELFDKNWMPTMGKLAADLKAGRKSLPGLAPCSQAHDALMKRLASTADACTALQDDEHAFAQQLGRLRDVLEKATY